LEEVQIKDRIRQIFGDLVFDDRGEIDRSRLGSRVFGESPQQQQSRKELEKLVHPRIKELLSDQIDHVQQTGTVEAIFLDAAVLFEAGWNDLCDLVVFVDTPLSTRRQRVAESRGWDEEMLCKRESSQWSLERKRQHADWTIDNSNSLDDAARQLEQILNGIHKHDS
jgi:dephospho-CoA kinase